MVRIIIATILAALVLFFWNFASWVVLHLHDSSVHSLKDESAMVDALNSQELKPGYYILPSPPDDESSTEKMEAFMKRHKDGPVVSIIYSGGQDPMTPKTMGIGFGLCVLSAFIAACLLSGATCCRYYLQRVGFVFGLGLFAASVSYPSLWNWMYYPLDFTLAMCADILISWLLSGILMAIIIRPKPETT